MKACILAGGKGERLKPLTDELPKVMLPVGSRLPGGGKPLLQVLVEGLVRHGITDLVLCVSYQGEKIMAHFGAGKKFGARITYAVDPTYLGTAGSIRQLAGPLGNPFLVVYGDVASKLDYTSLLQFHRQKKAPLATLVLHESDHPQDSDLAELDAEGRLTFFGRNPKAKTPALTNAGAYVLDPALLDCVPAGQRLDFGKDVFPGLVKAGKPLYGYITSDYMKDIGTLERYQQVKEEFSLDC